MLRDIFGDSDGDLIREQSKQRTSKQQGELTAYYLPGATPSLAECGAVRMEFPIKNGQFKGSIHLESR